MTPAARLAAVIEIIDEMEETHLAGYGLRRGLQRRRYAGSGDRQAISAMFWQVHRAWARLFWHLQQCGCEVTARSITIAAQMLVDRQLPAEITALFGGEGTHNAAALSADELELVAQLAERQLDHPDMPRDVALEWPDFLMADAVAALGESAEAELLALQGEAATDVRSNPVKLGDRRVLREKFAGRGLKCHLNTLSPIGIRLEKRTRTEDLPEWKKGLFEYQDEGSQIAALLCDARPGMQVVDMCAGAGGKALVMAAQMQNRGRVLALDSDAERLERGGERMRRAGIHNIERKHVGDSWGTKRWRGKFDRVVIDAPCSGSGTWRRQVDARWRCSSDDLARYTSLQAQLLDKGRAMVMPGGRIIYITCSVLASEGAAQIDRLLAEAPELELANIGEIWQDTIGTQQGGACPPLDGGMLRLLPGRDGTDGFFVAVLQARLR